LLNPAVKNKLLGLFRTKKEEAQIASYAIGSPGSKFAHNKSKISTLGHKNSKFSKGIKLIKNRDNIETRNDNFRTKKRPASGVFKISNNDKSRDGLTGGKISHGTSKGS
jgi:hypothetical protein